MILHRNICTPILHRRPWVSACVCLLLLLFGGSVTASEHRKAQGERSQQRVYAAEVTRVFDGDTLWVRPEGGGRYRKLRIEGIDAPEICQPGGIAARDALARLVRDQTVVVQVRRYDTYGRALVRMSLDGQDVGALLVGEGHAWSYRWQRHQGPYAEEEILAKRQRRGLFAQANPEPPRQFRQRHGPCPQP